MSATAGRLLSLRGNLETKTHMNVRILTPPVEQQTNLGPKSPAFSMEWDTHAEVAGPHRFRIRRGNAASPHQNDLLRRPVRTRFHAEEINTGGKSRPAVRLPVPTEAEMIGGEYTVHQSPYRPSIHIDDVQSRPQIPRQIEENRGRAGEALTELGGRPMYF
jgi:hypothetical protein